VGNGTFDFIELSVQKPPEDLADCIRQTDPTPPDNHIDSDGGEHALDEGQWCDHHDE
jgi:hypothetical protein